MLNTVETTEETTGYEIERILKLRSGKFNPRPDYLATRGRFNHGPTPPRGSLPSSRETDLTKEEVEELIALIVQGRHSRTPVVTPERLRARSWPRPSRFFVNYRLCEFEFVYQLGISLSAHDKEYTEADLLAAIKCSMLVIQIGDSILRIGTDYVDTLGGSMTMPRERLSWLGVET